MNIIIDTNIIRKDLKLKSNKFDIIRDYLQKTNSSFILPRIVLLEIEGIYKRLLNEKVNSLKGSAAKINEITFKTQDLYIPDVNLEEEVKTYTDFLKEELRLSNDRIIEIDNEHLPEIISRCIDRIKPAKEDGKQFRDVVLWLSLDLRRPMLTTLFMQRPVYEQIP